MNIHTIGEKALQMGKLKQSGSQYCRFCNLWHLTAGSCYIHERKCKKNPANMRGDPIPDPDMPSIAAQENMNKWNPVIESVETLKVLKEEREKLVSQLQDLDEQIEKLGRTINQNARNAIWGENQK